MTNTESPHQVLLGYGFSGRLEKVDLASVMPKLNEHLSRDGRFQVEAFHAFTAYLTKQNAVWFADHAVLAPLSSGLEGQWAKDIIRAGKAKPLREAMHDIQLVNMYGPVWQMQVGYGFYGTAQVIVEAEDADDAEKIAEAFFRDHLSQAGHAKRKKIVAGLIQDAEDDMYNSGFESASSIEVGSIEDRIKRCFMPPDYDAAAPLEDLPEE
jgi:hypothetical protein